MEESGSNLRAPSSFDNVKRIADVLASCALLVACVAVSWSLFVGTRSRPGGSAVAQQPAKQRNIETLPSEPLSIVGAARKGSPTAKLALIVFSDFQCPYCAKFAVSILPALEEKYVRTGKVLLLFRHFPLPIHAAAQKAAEAAECAGLQGKFWEMHDQLFKNSRRLGEVKFGAGATLLGLDRVRFESCLSGQTAERVSADVADGKRYLVKGTPAFFIGTLNADGRVTVVTRVSGAKPVTAFEVAIDAALGESNKRASLGR